MDLTEGTALARGLLREHALDHWTFRYDRSRRRFGACHYSTSSISLSRTLTLLNDSAIVRGVLLHEVAHALAGHRAGHGPRWRRIAEGLGVNPRRGLDPNELAVPTPRYAGTCPACGTTIRRHRRDRVACKQCCDAHGGRFNARFLYVWTVPAADAA